MKRQVFDSIKFQQVKFLSWVALAMVVLLPAFNNCSGFEPSAYQDLASLDGPNLQPPADGPPLSDPPPAEDEPPMDEPPVDEPPMDEPPMDEPPMDEPPMDEPPVDEPPMDEPPMDEPPVDEPPVDEPPAGIPPDASLGNPKFKESSLPADVQIWYQRFMNALTSSRQYPNALSNASSGDIYKLGRHVGRYTTTALTVFRFTGDLRILDQVDRVMQEARKQLRDTNGDGYLNWRWLHDPGDSRYYGDDLHVMDEVMSHGMLAKIVWVYGQNQDMPSPSGVSYRERFQFWRGYLFQWEAKWRARNRKSSGFPFIKRDLTHPHLNIVRYHWYTYRITGDRAYLNEAKRLMSLLTVYEFKHVNTPYGQGLVWPHGLTRENPKVDYFAPFNYSEYSAQILMDLALDSFPDLSEKDILVPVANTLAHLVIDNGSSSFAPSIGGSRAHSGIAFPDSAKRGTRDQWAIYPLSEYAAFDASGKIHQVNKEVYNALEGSGQLSPSRLAIPAAMVLKGLMERQ